jgi:hypothetical protein
MILEKPTEDNGGELRATEKNSYFSVALLSGLCGPLWPKNCKVTGFKHYALFPMLEI